jgi:peptidoglycan-N-acetylmuramic acid deacetylase
MRKIIKKISLLLFLLAITTQQVNAMPDTRPYGWYFKKEENGKQPKISAELSFIEKYNGKWIDNSVNDDDKVIYLTFDAGYENGNVEKILDVLKEKQVPGTFFILENLVKRNPDIVKRMNDEGHTIGNHTSKHPDMSKICDKSIFKSQLTGLEEVCEEKLGITISKYFRPPEGRFSELCMSYLDSLGYKTIFWSFAYADWDNAKQPDPKKSVENIISHTHNGMVILLHPTSKTNSEILGELIDKWREMGYRFGTADELFS